MVAYMRRHVRPFFVNIDGSVSSIMQRTVLEKAIPKIIITPHIQLENMHVSR